MAQPTTKTATDRFVICKSMCHSSQSPVRLLIDYITAWPLYKVPQRYLDRERYPLKAFAKAMTVDSASGSGWTIDGDLTPIQIDGKPAYRLLAHISDRMVKKKGYIYVGEVNGYVFILIGTTSYLLNAQIRARSFRQQ